MALLAQINLCFASCANGSIIDVSAVYFVGIKTGTKVSDIGFKTVACRVHTVEECSLEDDNRAAAKSSKKVTTFASKSILALLSVKKSNPRIKLYPICCKINTSQGILKPEILTVISARPCTRT